MDTKKQQTTTLSKPPMTGKKRKKKKTKIDKEGCTTKVTQSPKKNDSVPLTSSITISKIDAQCSSSSSIESQKPVLKLPKIEDIDKKGSTKSNDIVMDSGADSTTGSMITTTSNRPDIITQPPPSYIITSDESTDSMISNNSASVYKVKTVANLRWINELSDEEKERERIEEYKQGRRERYKRDLQMKKEQRGEQRSQSCHPNIIETKKIIRCN